MVLRLSVTFLLALLAGNVAAGDFELYFHDGYVDEYSSSRSLFKRMSCDRADHYARFALSRNDIKKLTQLVSVVDFFRLPKEINQNVSKSSDGDNEEIVVCSACSSSTLRIRVGRKMRTIKWSCNCETHGDPEPLQPLMNELRGILYGAPAIAELPKSSCAFY